jgi:transcriptional regulator with XRE-family HTH domain
VGRPKQRQRAPAPDPASHAALIGRLFLDLRRALHLSLPDVAGRLGTRIDTLEALERGDVRFLPPWPETQRIVSAYTRLAAIDAGPVLAVIRREMDQEVKTLDLAPIPSDQSSGLRSTRYSVQRAMSSVSGRVRSVARTMPGKGAALPAYHAARAVAGRLSGGGSRGRWRYLGLLVTIPVALFVSFGGVGTLRTVAASMPQPIASVAREIDDYFLSLRAEVREGLVWIDVDDPRSRKANKLQSGHR